MPHCAWGRAACSEDKECTGKVGRGGGPWCYLALPPSYLFLEATTHGNRSKSQVLALLVPTPLEQGVDGGCPKNRTPGCLRGREKFPSMYPGQGGGVPVQQLQALAMRKYMTGSWKWGFDPLQSNLLHTIYYVDAVGKYRRQNCVSCQVPFRRGLGKMTHRSGEGGREHDSLAVGADVAHDACDLGLEAHVKHPVSFIQDQIRHPATPE